jgi:hypothetical protein
MDEESRADTRIRRSAGTGTAVLAKTAARRAPRARRCAAGPSSSPAPRTIATSRTSDGARVATGASHATDRTVKEKTDEARRNQTHTAGMRHQGVSFRVGAAGVGSLRRTDLYGLQGSSASRVCFGVNKVS